MTNLRDSHPDTHFVNLDHAFVSGVIAAELMKSESFTMEVDSSLPVMRVRFGYDHSEKKS